MALIVSRVPLPASTDVNGFAVFCIVTIVGNTVALFFAVIETFVAGDARVKLIVPETVNCVDKTLEPSTKTAVTSVLVGAQVRV